jgi:hypothetical protein
MSDSMCGYVHPPFDLPSLSAMVANTIGGIVGRWWTGQDSPVMETLLHWLGRTNFRRGFSRSRSNR